MTAAEARGADRTSRSNPAPTMARRWNFIGGSPGWWAQWVDIAGHAAGGHERRAGAGVIHRELWLSPRLRLCRLLTIGDGSVPGQQKVTGPTRAECNVFQLNISGPRVSPIVGRNGGGTRFLHPLP